MEKLDPKTDGQSQDIVQENINQLKTLFPDVFTEGKIDFEALKENLGEYIDDREERYNFSWNGKSKARMLAQTPSNGTLRPCPEESVDWTSTKNLFIEGDNLEALKLLQKSYHKKIKLIYIDPPYNTGKDFIYSDDFKDNIKNYLEQTNQTDKEGKKLSVNYETSGRFHTEWLNMVYPRLLKARNLLRDDGFLVVSIDDGEVSNLIFLLNEVFGEENKIATLVWDRNRKNDAKYFSVGHEYMLVYCKNIGVLKDNKIILREPKEGIEKAHKLFIQLKKKYNDDWQKIQVDWRNHFNSLPSSSIEKKLGRYSKINERGPFRDDGNISWPGGGGPKYIVLHPITKKPCKVPEGGWRYSTQERFWEDVGEGKVVFGDDETTLPRQCRYLFEGDGQVMPSVFYSYAQTAAMDFLGLMENRVFENPKYWKDIQRLINYLSKPGDLILDFFSGSGTTAHSVVNLNCKENEDRKFILIQIPEPCNEKSEAFKAGYKTIADIGKERIQRVFTKIKKDHPDYKGDLGFKVFKLDSTNIKPWDISAENLTIDIEDFISNIKTDRSEDDILYEILLKYGLDLTLPIEERTISGNKVFIIGFGGLIICLSDDITIETVEGIAALKAELKPEVMRVVFKDNGFKSDDVKANTIQVLRQQGIEDVRSL